VNENTRFTASMWLRSSELRVSFAPAPMRDLSWC
jgi:hypothetical protein